VNGKTFQSPGSDYIENEDKISLFHSVINKRKELSHVGDYIKYVNEDEEVIGVENDHTFCQMQLFIPCTQIHIGKIMSCIKTATSCSYCVVQLFVPLLDQEILNDMDCPLLQCTSNFYVVPSIGVQASISVVHECLGTCIQSRGKRVMTEREETLTNMNYIKHDYTNDIYSLNLYCSSYY